MAIQQYLETIFDADRALRTAERSLLAPGDDGHDEDVAAALAKAVDDAYALSDNEESTARLERLADLCAQVPGPQMADSLIQILDHEDPRVRVAAGEAVLDVAHERYVEIARAVERCLEKKATGPAMEELPWILVEIVEPSAFPLLRRFLSSPAAGVVGAAIEALAQLGDPSAIDVLAPLTTDPRVVSLPDLEDEFETTIGQLAEETIAHLDESFGADEQLNN